MLTYKYKSKLTTKTLQHSRLLLPPIIHQKLIIVAVALLSMKMGRILPTNIEIEDEKVNSHQTTKKSRGKGLQGAIEPDKGHTRVRADKQQPQAPHLTGAKSGMNTWCPCHAPA